MLQTNGTLTKVTAAPSAETWDGPGVGPDKWTGTSPCYLRETRRRVETIEGSDVILDRILLVDLDAPVVDWRIGDQVTVQRMGDTGPETARVAIVQRPNIDDPDIPEDMITVRLTLTSR